MCFRPIRLQRCNISCLGCSGFICGCVQSLVLSLLDVCCFSDVTHMQSEEPFRWRSFFKSDQKQPEVFVCALKPSVTGSRPAPRPWFNTFASTPRRRPWNASRRCCEVATSRFSPRATIIPPGSTAFVRCHFSNADLSNGWINAFHVSLTSLLVLSRL